MAAYELVLHEDAARRLVAASRAEQRRVGMILERLKSAPSRAGDLQEHDKNGRINEVVVDGDWLVTFWVDHAGREIRVMRIESAED
ncbi:MAG: hypothetical protein JNK23_17525 [Opitutaceae bacterium]|nr:hypothetical protein [Opitutaceae bacterium]